MKALFQKLLDLLQSQKFQIFVFSQVLTIVIIVGAAKYGVSAQTLDLLLELALGKLGVEASVLKAVHAYVDAHATAASIEAESRKSAVQVAQDMHDREVAALRDQVKSLTQQLAPPESLTQQLAPPAAAPPAAA